MTARMVHWHEGMFLWPQQLQHHDRSLSELVHRQQRNTVHYGWGLRAIECDLKALANFQFAVARLQARLHDGSIVSVPEDGTLAPLDLKPAFDRGGPVTIFLGIPVLHQGKPNVRERIAADAKSAVKPEPKEAVETRYLVDTLSLEDENTGEDAQPIQVRWPNIRLLHSHQDLSGYETLAIARVDQPPQAPPRLDPTFIPPILACDAWQPLQAGFLQAMYDRFGRHIELISRQVISRGVSFDSRNPGDSLLLSQLHAVNQAFAVLGVLAFANGVHPYQAFLELCRCSGRLAIYSETRKPPALPIYDHDDLGACFNKLRLYLDTIVIQEPSYEERPFVGKGPRIQVVLEPKWLESAWDMFVGVQSALPPDETVKLLTRAGPLDMKIGSTLRVDEIYERAQVGLEFTPCPRPPRALPNMPGLVYFQVNRTSKQEEWQNVQKSLALAIRLNQSRILGNIENQRVINIRTGVQNTTMQFTLFLLPRDQGVDSGILR